MPKPSYLIIQPSNHLHHKVIRSSIHPTIHFHPFNSNPRIPLPYHPPLIHSIHRLPLELVTKHLTFSNHFGSTTHSTHLYYHII
ncbi:hypothetical protein EYC84_005991 [Monilinia fructicola]|uniref:Uncharacterized protein n=1 Tax=Monilinia fructicola TaxID=38448 RepID=A0A5M9K290_MONFR|nr:hypothetical protein EYC84_005991 [Monilinia fructicola]